ncbi:MAG TPA: hypothetical protein VD772_03740 [Anseongella sp.]|nr:hypothetical protein [Anseongella sp.]
MKKITNIDELRAEIFRLKQQKRQHELSLKKRADDLANKFKPVLKVLDFFGVDTEGSSREGSKRSFGQNLLKKGLEYGLPFAMNRLFFRSKVKAGISSLLGIALGEGAKNYLSADSSKIVDPIVGFIRNLVDGTRETRKARKEKRSFANRYDNLEREIYS